MKYINRIIVSTCLVFAAQVVMACDYPSERASIPRGDVSKDELLAAQRSVKAYMAALSEYRECIVEEEKLARLAMADLAPEVEQQREEMLNKKFNAAIEDEERVAAQFNEAVQAYKKNNP